VLQDFLFRYISRESGRLGLAVHIHSLEGAGNYFTGAGADPLLLEPSLNDAALRQTNFVVIHGGGALASHTSALLWKPNVFADISLMTLVYSPAQLADVLRGWLTEFPEKVLYGSDATALGPDMGWELTAWSASRTARAALAIALTGMMDDGAIDRARAEAIATMVMRTNAARLYKLDLK
jgi:predicted TIM-barrel fold metal-dependent hydrolase